MSKHWYDQQTIYQIYPKSFNDSNHDGIGDIPGITAKIPYLKQLGITTIWLNPIYQSPQVDNGYDVSDYYQVDSSLGTMTDVETLIKTVHEHGMYLIFDFVLNHTSDQHPWFKQALADPQSKYRDYYLWQDPAADGGRPNNWGSFFGGSVWAKDPAGGSQYYFHLFDKRMPDLNWKTPAVQQAMRDVAEFWVEKGIDGLRLDAFIHLAKADFRQIYPNRTGDSTPIISDMFYAHLPKVHQYLHDFVAAIKAKHPDTYVVGEASSADPHLMVDYTTPGTDECDQVITFRTFADDNTQDDPSFSDTFQPRPMDVTAYKQNTVGIQAALADTSLPTLYWNNHDMARVATRYGDPDYPQASAKALATALYLQRGIPIIYYGEELGLTNIRYHDIADFEDQTVPTFVASAQAAGKSKVEIMRMLNQTHKMAGRGPMQWDNTVYHGFSDHLPWKHGDTDDMNAQAEIADPDSIYHYYQQLLQLKQCAPFTNGQFIMLGSAEQLFTYLIDDGQKQAAIVCNLSAQAQTYLLPFVGGKVLLVQGGATYRGRQVTLPAWSSLVVKSA
ncbi:alpha-glucosidase [Lactiplantibacillus plantarum]|uniref:alpha-glucosidase n=1 Tax=Lactiplantibacillus plantarum TaxID=1590 RepID=UPI000B3E7D17|nr:alpha-glucosidase [Lactiplantibacillus plantarum]ARW34176.1 Alpha-glucosidase [Lactiplantibacillus plantarum]